MTGRGLTRTLIAAAAALCLVAPAGAQRVSSLTGSAHLARAYDAIFDARFDEVPRLLERGCAPRAASAPAPAPAARRIGTGSGTSAGNSAGNSAGERAPAEACELLEVLSLWWQMQLDADSLADDARFARCRHRAR